MHGPPVAASNPTALRVLCVDDNRSYADLLHIALQLEPDLECVGCAQDIDQALQLVAATQPDVVLMDYNLPGPDGIEGVRRVKRERPDTRVILLTAFGALDLVVRAASGGADGFLSKDCPLDEILEALRRPGDGIELDGATLDAVRDRVSPEGLLHGRRWDPHLTERERDVLGLLAEGMDPQSIARHLGITTHTSRGYVRNVLSKLGAHSQLEAVVIAMRAGIVNEPKEERQVC